MKINDMLKERKGKLIGDIAIAVFFGVMLILAGDMVFGGGENAETENETVKNNVSDNDYLSKLEEKTKGLLSQVDGAGNVDVMITLNSEGESVYAVSYTHLDVYKRQEFLISVCPSAPRAAIDKLIATLWSL